VKIKQGTLHPSFLQQQQQQQQSQQEQQQHTVQPMILNIPMTKIINKARNRKQ
jgi:hypothetical protein